MKRFISLFMTVIMIFSVVISTDMLSVSATDNSNIKWSFDSKTGTLTISGTGKMLGDYINENPWSKYKNDVTTVIINEGITTIGHGAFIYFRNIRKVTIPNSVKSIKEAAFEDCSSLKNIVIPNSVVSIETQAFCNCKSLSNIKLSNSLTEIQENAFMNCISLKNITIPNSVNFINAGAFAECSNLTSVTILNGVTSIGKNAFCGCTSLASITIPSSVNYIGKTCFYLCTNLKTINVDKENKFFYSKNGVLYYKDKQTTTLLFYSPANTNTSFSVPDGVNKISDYAFNDSKLKSIYIPKSVKTLEMGFFQSFFSFHTFKNCNKLETINVDADNENYCSENGIIYDKNKTVLIKYPPAKKDKSFIAPNTVLYVNTDAFNNCNNLINIKFFEPTTDSFFYIDSLAFYNCNNLESVILPNLMTEISSATFEYCKNLKNVVIPNSVSEIKEYAFCGCSSLTNITIPNSVTSICIGAFEDCLCLKSITIPNNVTSIGYSTFSGCSNLKDIYYEGTKSQWEKLQKKFDIVLDKSVTIHYGKKDNPSSDKPSQKTKFTLGKNNNSYYHSDENISKSGFKGVKDYSLDKSYYNKLVKGRSNSEIKYLQKNMKNSWNGSCFGIASTMGLLYNKNIKSQDISSSANKNYYQLPLPYKDKKFLNNIQYYYMIQNIGYSRSRSLAVTSSYSMGWVLRGLNYFSDWIKDDSEENCLKTIVEKVKNTSSKHKTYMFTFSTKEGYSHAVLITDIEYSKDNKEYTLTIFDENSVTPKYPNGMYGTLKIADNYKSFIYDCDGVKFNNENYTNIQLFDLDEVKKAANKPELYAVNDHNRSNSTIRMALNKDMKITNESGKYIQIKDGKIDTNTEINSLYSYTIGNQGMISIDIEGSNFKVSDLDKKCNVSISNDKTFMSLEGNNIKSANLSLNNKKITCSGNGNDKYNFDATCSTDSIVNSSTKETGMLEVKGTAKGNTTTTVNSNKLTTTSDSLENAVGNNYIDNMVTKENLTKNKVIKKATVIVRKSINKCKTNKLKTITYNGKIKKPSVTVKYENRKLVVNKDYKISYSNNKNAGKGKITISGINNYVGTKTLYFSINKAKPTVKFAKPSVTIKKSKKTYVNKLKKKTDGKIVYSSSNKKIAVVNSKGKVTFKRKGKVKIYAQTVKSKNYYNTKTYYVLKIK